MTDRNYNREWNYDGVKMAKRAIREACRILAPLSDDTLAGLLDDLEQTGSCEVPSHITASKRPEIITADPTWFDEIK